MSDNVKETASIPTAREQAREAVVDSSWKDEGPRRWPESVEHLADIASDVWEPLLRDLADAVWGYMEDTDQRPYSMSEAYWRVKAALGEKYGSYSQQEE